ncbi:MAG: B12-binding domain-containing radical SAM protein [Lachnospiraceae bacterium]|nr:B12-binding domain-containing radical SAM protein [Lachnospiraceae bacterium]
MKILLTAINAKYIHSNLAVYDLRAYCREYTEQIELAEYTINHNPEHILADIFRRRPQVAAFSCYIWNIVMVETLIEEIRKVLPETELWLGGPEVSYRAEELLRRHHCLKGIMAGEGESTLCQLMEYYVKHSRKLSEVQNLVYRDGEEIHRTPWGEMLALSDIPFPYENLEEFENRIIYYESSRGCPFSCSYCLSSVEKKLRFRDTDMVKRELQFFLDRKTAQVKFVDRTFNVWHEHAMAVWQYIYEHDNGITNFHFEIAADLLNEEELALMKQMRPGLIQLEIGVQSVNERTLQEIRRTTHMDKLRQTVAAIREKRNIHVHLDLIAGLPYEDYDSFCHSFNEVYAMEPDQLQLGFLKVLSGTDMEKRADEYGLVFRDMPPYEVLFTNWISFEELLKLKGVEEMVEVYYNSAQFTASMKLLLRCFETPFAMYAALADYYEQRGLTDRKQNRVDRYEILLEFAKAYLRQEQTERFRECLVYDLYLRDNMKNRPEFAPSAEPYKDEIKEFYRKEAGERRYLPEYEGCDGKQLARMTHVEHFSRHPLTGEEQELFLLFDYKNRNPLSFEAKVTELDIGKERHRNGELR